MLKVGIIGATGYAGIELTRILSAHSYVIISSLVSKSFEGQNISEVYPSLTGIVDVNCDNIDIPSLAKNCDLVFSALPHGVSLNIVPELINNGCKVIDLSGDFRYKSATVYEEWYNIKHIHTELLTNAIYGLTELNRLKIAPASLIANPGCYPTCSLLSLAPLISKKLVNYNSIIIDAVSGVSGAGRTSSLPFQFTECAENFRAYKVASHRHTSEIEQELSVLADEPIVISFTPHLAPLKRGMLITAYANLNKEVSEAELYDIYREFYMNEFFVRIRPAGMHPQTKWVAGSNFIDIGLTVDKRTNRVIVVGAIDNLIKGTAGQAVQNMNLMLGFDETEGLRFSGQYI